MGQVGWLCWPLPGERPTRSTVSLIPPLAAQDRGLISRMASPQGPPPPGDRPGLEKLSEAEEVTVLLWPQAHPTSPTSAEPFGFVGGPRGHNPGSRPTLCPEDPQHLSMSPVCLDLELQRARLPRQ